jgi:anti-anti-sigma regulatory factor
LTFRSFPWKRPLAFGDLHLIGRLARFRVIAISRNGLSGRHFGQFLASAICSGSGFVECLLLFTRTGYGQATNSLAGSIARPKPGTMQLDPARTESLMTMVVEPQAAVSPTVTADRFSVITEYFDRNRAGLRVVGRLDTGTAPVLACVTDGHLRADRRYLRMNVSRVCSVDEEAIDVLHELHRQLLARRGTLIITGVGVSLEAALTRLSGELFLLAPTAADPID